MRFSYTARMKHDYDAEHLNIAAFARASGAWDGEARLAQFARLMEETRGQGGDMAVRYVVRGEMRGGGAGVEEAWLHLAAQAVLPLTCQRCLGSVEVPVAFEREFRFVATEELAAVEDEESEEDVLVLSRDFNVLALVEDELLMELPVAPKHSVCPVPVKLQAADPNFVDEPTEKPNPFAVLQQLKKKGAP